MTIPPGVEEHGRPGDIGVGDEIRRELRALTSNSDARQACQAIEWHGGEVGTTLPAVCRRIQVGAGVGDHLDSADVELGSRRVVSPGIFERYVVGDDGTGEPGVGDHPVLDDVAQIEQLH